MSRMNVNFPGVGSLNVLGTGSPGHVCATLFSSLTRTIDVASGNVTVQGKLGHG